MKGTMAYLACILFVIGLASAATYTPPNLPTILGNSVRISQETYYAPYPIAPGGLFDLWVRVDNQGKAGDPVLFNVQCQVVERFPFSSAYPDDNLIRTIGSLGPAQPVLLKFKLRADANAAQGRNNILFRCSTEGSQPTDVDLEVEVKSAAPIVEITSLSSSPAEFAPGGTGTATFTLRNQAKTLVKNIQLNIDFSSATLPVSPLGNSGESFIPELAANSDKQVSMDLVISPSAEPGPYKMPVTLTYEDEMGNVYNSTATVTISVYSAPEVLISLDRTDIIKNSAKGSVFLAFTNRGLSGVKRLTATISQGDGFVALSPPTVYVGDIDSNDFQTMQIDIYANTTGQYLTIPVSSEYRDALNRIHTQKDMITVRVYTQDELYRLQLEQAGTSLTMVLIIGILLVVAYLAYRRFVKKK